MPLFRDGPRPEEHDGTLPPPSADELAEDAELERIDAEIDLQEDENAD